ncbi:MAG: hypothetical protein INH43_09205 [Acidobacteriaceae bacterium]|jgi:uncharacterized protein (TIGR03437 family)|nr:hypothetical protein [Acidobacteriaceae bacterium]
MKNRFLPLFGLAGLLAATAAAQPVVTGALNTASYALSGLPNGSLAQGSMIAIFGRNLGPASIALAQSFPLPRNLGGTAARLTAGGANYDLILTYSVASQVGAIIPSNTPVGAAQLTVTFGGQTSANFAVNIVRSSFGIFTANQGGSGPAIAQNFNSQTDQPINSILNAARPGQTITLWGTGLGPISGDDAAGAAPGDLGTAVEVLVGNRPATIRYRGRSGCCAGVDQIVFDVPTGIQGCYVPLTVRIGNIVSNSTYLAITPNGGRCSAGTPFSDADLQKVSSGGTLSIGSINLNRNAIKFSLGGSFGTLELKLDNAAASFVRFTAAQLTASQFAAGNALPLGSCLTFSSSDQATSLPPDPIVGAMLDAGPKLTVTGPLGTREMLRDAASGSYSASFSSGTPSIPGLPSIPGMPGGGGPFFDAGAFTIDNGAGAVVGGFRAQLTIPGNFTWTNENSVNTINRAAGQEFTWSGAGANSTVSIQGFSFDAAARAGGGFFCLERGSANRFTVPASVLLALPRNVAAPGQGSELTPTGQVGIGLTSDPVRFTANNLDVGVATHSATSLKGVNVQ